MSDEFSSEVTGRVVNNTILDYLEIDSEVFEFEGASLLPVLEGEKPAREFAFSDQRELRSADDGHFHLILNGEEGTATLFDLGLDPGEQFDLFKPDHPEAVRLSEALNGWLTDTGQLMRFDEELAAARAKEEELRALGYLE